MPLAPRSARRMIGSRLPSRSGYLARSAWNDDCASLSLCCDETCTAYPAAERVSRGFAFVEPTLATDMEDGALRDRTGVPSSPAGTSASGAFSSAELARAAPRAADRAADAGDVASVLPA